MIDDYLEVLDLKDVKRTGWQIHNVENPETVAAHSWSVAALTMLHLPEELDESKALKIALIHDIGESKMGDIPYSAEKDYGREDKEEQEQEAVKKLSESLSDELLGLWREYEDRESSEAKFVKDMDLVDLCLQALKYESEDRYEGNPETDFEGLDEFFETSRGRFNTGKGLELFEKIEQKYRREKT